MAKKRKTRMMRAAPMGGVTVKMGGMASDYGCQVNGVRTCDTMTPDKCSMWSANAPRAVNAADDITSAALAAVSGKPKSSGQY